MSYQVLARKWRPLTFDEIVGQEHVTTTLANALAKGRVAHAYLFTGPRGCGKTTMARLMAKALNCDEGPSAQPCGKCPSCEGIAAGNFLDVMEIDAASHTGVDNIRELRENAQYQPSAGKKRVFIIDEVHMLSKGAFNALLKTLEEPPEHVHFVFATTEPVRIPRTILSRCQRFDFRLFSLAELRDHIRDITTQEKVDVADDAVELLASLAEGSMRDALSLLDQAVSSSEGQLDAEAVLGLYGLVGHEPYLEMNEAILQQEPRLALDLIDGLVQGGHDLVEFARGLVSNFRDLMMLRLDASLADRVEKPEAVKQQLSEQAARFEAADLLHLTQRAAEHYAALERAPQPRWLLEAQVVEYATHDSRVMLSEILGRLQAIDGGENPDPGSAPRRASKSKAKTSASKPPATKRAQASEDERSARRPSAKVAAPPEAPAPAEPVAEPAPRPTPRVESNSGAKLTIDEGLREPWARFAARVRDEHIAIGTCLVEAVPRLEGDTLYLVFKPEHAFHRDQVASAPSIDTMNPIAVEVFGRKLQLSPVTERPHDTEENARREVQAEVAPSEQQALDRQAEANPHLGRLLDGLGGRVDS